MEGLTMAEYRVINKSVSYHCCFEATVVKVDPHGKADEEHGFAFETMCECFCVEDANKICAALNKAG